MSCEFNPKRPRHRVQHFHQGCEDFKEIGITVIQFLEETKHDIENVLLENKASWHKSCRDNYNSLYNRARPLKKQCSDAIDSSSVDLEDLAFAELIGYIEECLEQESPGVLTLSELVKFYQCKLKEVGAEGGKTNATRLKKRVLEAVPDLTAHPEGRQVILASRHDLGGILTEAKRRDSDAWCLARAAHVVRKDILKVDNSFTVSCFEELGNPFTEESDNLMAIHTKDIMDDSVVATVKNAHKIGEEQFCLVVKERFIDRSKPVTEPLKQNNLPTFSTPTKKAVSKDQAKVKLLKEDCSLFGRLYIACQTRDGNLDEFFSYENQPWPPSLSDQGQLRGGQKADLLRCLPQATSPVSTPPVDAVIRCGYCSNAGAKNIAHL